MSDEKFVAPMICGGLGNQLFILAAALGYAQRTGRRLWIDTSKQESGSVFRNRPTYWNTPLMSKLLQHSSVVLALPPITSQRTVTEDQLRTAVAIDERDFDEQLIWLRGYFQDAAFFAAADNELFSINAETVPEAFIKFEQCFGCDLRSVRAVSLHVRRGDYLQLQHVYTIVDVSYCERAVDLLRPPADAHVVVFSDDADWARRNLAHLHNKMIFVDDRFTDVECFALMQACTGAHIISNSTFSWWPAYVCWRRSQCQMPVVVPRPWFADGRHFNSLYMSGWHTIDVG